MALDFQATTDDLDPIPHATVDDPHPVYRRLREEHPVHYVEARDLWVLSRHADILAAIKDAQAKAAQRMEQEMAKVTEGLGLPAGMANPFG